ncbi:MAG TPA: tail fiber domain-containing protein, partial [Pyrinomonadaceae bacterium]|nr:tail fiber domain-containing protein [Pyrinomonadaceae bacterium]
NGTGFNNSFFGYRSGANTRDGSLNAFFGYQAGANNLTGTDNAFFGSGAGQNSTADNNSFFGGGSGFSNTIGFDNAFIGKNAGFKNVNGNGNTFLGANTGLLSVSGGANTFLGVQAGQGNVSGNENVFVGIDAGQTNLDGSDNTTIGTLADVASGSLRFATAIGARAVVSTNNTIQLGRANGFDHVRISGLGTAGTVALCLNANTEISTCSSSLRYKFNIAAFNPGLELLKRLRPVSFQWKANGLRDVGLVAEEVNQIEPLLTTVNDKGEIEGVKYDRIGVVLINSIKQQQAQIEAQQKQIEREQATIKNQQLELEALRQLVCSGKRVAQVCRSHQLGR